VSVKRIVLLFSLSAAAVAAAKPHSIFFGHAMTVKWFTGEKEDQGRELKIRPLYVDSKLREFTMGEEHQVTDRLLVVRRAYRINDVLPEESGPPRWKWQRDGWLLIDKQSGHVSSLKLPEFDPFYSAASWYRDYVAYCGVSPDAEKLYAVVTQIGSKKPLVRRELGAAHAGEQPDSECPPPEWQRQPPRVTFHPQGGTAVSFEVHGAVLEIATPEENPAEEEK